MFVPPQARYRMYGGVSNYLRALRDFVTGRVYAGDDTARVERRLATYSQTADAGTWCHRAASGFIWRCAS